ncbi:MAG: methyltransferase domain-containing protein [Deltaproteobacteria bacterium]|nr:methyltransferase domain-containing protein [Deltaproteobacteria bacterium]
MAEKFSNAEGYERQLGPWSSALAPRFIEFVGVQDGDRVLDVGSGTGSLALVLAASKSCSEIVGIDPSPPYIEFARSRASDPRVRFEVGDAKNLPYADAHFDKTLAQLVLNQVPDTSRAVTEMRRVTKPGGTVAACVWKSGKDNERNRLFWETAMAVDPAAAQRRETPGGYDRQGGLTALWAKCGLARIKETELVVAVDFVSFDAFWLPYLEGQAHAGSYVKSLSADRRSTLRERLRQDLLGTKPDGRFSIRAKAVAVRGFAEG